MTVLTDLQDTAELISAELKATYASPQPSYTVDGQSFSHTEYRAQLIRDLKEIQIQIVNLSGGEIATQGLG